jgi:hypothetical protein
MSDNVEKRFKTGDDDENKLLSVCVYFFIFKMKIIYNIL